MPVPPSRNIQPDRKKGEGDPVSRLVVRVSGLLVPGSLVTLIHCASGDYLRFLHDLVVKLLIDRRAVYALDFRRGLKRVYLHQALARSGLDPASCLAHLHHTVVLEEDHALSKYQHLYHASPERASPVVLLLDPSVLLGRQIGSVKQAAAALRLQYEAAQLLAQRGYAVVISDSGSHDPHRVECMVPSQLAEASTLILRFLPRRIIVEGPPRPSK